MIIVRTHRKKQFRIKGLTVVGVVASSVLANQSRLDAHTNVPGGLEQVLRHIARPFHHAARFAAPRCRGATRGCRLLPECIVALLIQVPKTDAKRLHHTRTTNDVVLIGGGLVFLITWLLGAGIRVSDDVLQNFWYGYILGSRQR